MELLLARLSSGPKDTLGLMYELAPGIGPFGGDLMELMCFTLERAKDDPEGHPRIPAGRYEILLRTEGDLTKRYAQRYPDMHRGMLWLQGTAPRKWIYIHVANDASKDLLGCIGVGFAAEADRINGEPAQLKRSREAYRTVYPRIVKRMEREQVFLTVKDLG